MLPLTKTSFDGAGRALGGHGRTLVMGILNVTPDSFTDGGHFLARDNAIAQARRLADEGADIVDIGGESTRPGASPVDEDEELRRVVPVLDALMPDLPCPVSIDTSKAAVARAALARGVSIVNDVWGFQRDPAMAETVAEGGAAAILMHNRTDIDTHIDIVADVLRFLEHSLALATRAGVPLQRIAVDPGIGFGKTLEQNLQLVAQLHRLGEFGVPILLGASRKSTIDKISPAPPLERIAGTVALHTAGILSGAAIIRAHDVREAVQAARVTDRLKPWWMS